MSGAAARRRLVVLGVPIDVLALDHAVQRIAAAAQQGRGGHVCLCNAHSVVTAQRDSAFARAIDSALLALPDGAPVAWMQRRLGAPGQRRVCGPDLMLAYCAHAAASAEPIYLYGSSEATLGALQARLLARWPALRIAGSHSPPFRPPTPQEQAADLQRIRDSGARSVWIGLGCPKQELWMATHSGQLGAVLIGVGAAFDFHAGVLPRAGTWIQRSGLEWLHRLITEPRRLARRYVVSNTLFILGAAAQLIGRRR